MENLNLECKNCKEGNIQVDVYDKKSHVETSIYPCDKCGHKISYSDLTQPYKTDN